jgi:hypothetical protein
MKALPALADATLADNETLPRYSGARILEEGPLVRKLGEDWEDRSQALEWVDGVLSGEKLGSCDGSQVYPRDGAEVPIGLVQTGIVYNGHTDDGDFSQQTEAEILTPADFREAKAFGLWREYVDARRFEAECQGLIRLMRDHGDITVLMDGPILISKIGAMQANIRNTYTRSATMLMRVSEETKNPVVGYVDRSTAADLARMMHFMYGLPEPGWVTDPLVLKDLEWGARTRAFLCDRDDRRKKEEGRQSVLDMYGEFGERLAFFYIRLNEGLPARVEMPAWVHEDGLTDGVADLLRAEVVLRRDYPDILVRAHENAVVTRREADLFFGMVGNFYKRHGHEFHGSQKEFHKRFGGSG